MIGRVNAPALLVLAGGLGSRFGGIKQMAPVGPGGEFILDYSVYDAWRCGFGKVVFLVRPGMSQALAQHFQGCLEGRVKCVFVEQRLEELPGGFTPPSERSKPWGTGHALWCARKELFGAPFAVVNADDFYGRRSFRKLAEFIAQGKCTAGRCAIAAFQLARTLSENGTVSRGVCTADEKGNLAKIRECTGIVADGAGGACCITPDGEKVTLPGDTPVSMNLWAFPQEFLAPLEEELLKFLSERREEAGSEFYLPAAVDAQISKGWQVDLLSSDEHWFGMTYTADLESARQRIAALVEAGIYPPRLWG